MRGFLKGLVSLGLTPLGCVLAPAMAGAQSFSPGGLATTSLPSLPAATAPAGQAAGGNGSGGNTGGGAAALASSLLGPFQYTLYGDLSERYTTDALGTSAQDTPDFDTRATLGLTATEISAHSNIFLNYYGSADYFARHSSDTVFTNNLNANAMVELVPDHVLVQAQAFAAPIYVSRLGAIAPSGETLPAGANSDLRNSYGVVLQPDFYFHIGNFLRSDLLPSYSASFLDQLAGAGPVPGAIPIADNIFTRGVTEKITSGDYFSRLQWSLIASYSEMGRSTGGLIQRSATGELSYAIDHDISVEVSSGYQNVSAGISIPQLSGPVFLGGMKFDFSRLKGTFLVGEQYRSFSGVGHVSYQITPMLSVSADATNSVSTPGAALLTPDAILSSVASAIQSGQIQLPSSGLLTIDNALLNSIGLENQIARIRTETVGVNYQRDDLSITVGGFITTQDGLSAGIMGQNQNLQRQAAEIAAGYSFTPELRGSLDASYGNETLALGSDHTAQYRADAYYNLSEQTDLYADLTYLQRFSNTALSAVSNSSGSLGITSFTVGIRHTFF